MQVHDCNLVLWFGIGFILVLARMVFGSQIFLLGNRDEFLKSRTNSLLYGLLVNLLFYTLWAAHLRRFLDTDWLGDGEFWLEIALLFALGLCIFTVHWVLRAAISWLLKDGEMLSKNYRHNIFLKSYFIFVLWLLLLVFEWGTFFQGNLELQVQVFVVLYGIYVLLNFWKDHFDTNFSLSYSMYHKFLYLCALEILPFAVICKILFDLR